MYNISLGVKLRHTVMSFSKYKNRITVFRGLTYDERLYILEQLRNSTILKFPEFGAFGGDVLIDIEATGYMEKGVRVVRLTNDERRLLIQKIKSKVTRIKIVGNDYTNSLPEALF